MILYKERLSSIIQENCIMLELKDRKAYVYLTKATYDQALLLSDRYNGELPYLSKVILGTCEKVSADDMAAIHYFFEKAPEPLNILAPFLGLCKSMQLQKDMKLLCGVLHMMSMAIDFNAFTLVPEEVRADCKFTRSMLNSYEQSWKDHEERIKITDIDIEDISVNAVADVLKVFMPVFSSIQMPSTTIAAAEPMKAEESSVSITDENQDTETEDEDIWGDFDSAFDSLNFAIPEVDEKPVETTEAEEVIEDVTKVKTEAEKEVEAINSLIAKLSGGI